MPLSQYILFFKPIGFFKFNLIVFVGRYWKQLPYTLPIWILFISYTVFEIFEFKVLMAWLDFWLLTFRDHLGSKLFPTFEIPYITSYLLSIDTFSLSRTVLEIFDLKVLKVWPWPLIFRGHLKSKIFSPVESPYMPSCLTSINTFYLVPFSRYLTPKFLGFDLDLGPLGVTQGQKYVHQSKAHKWLPILLLLALALYLVPFSRYSTSKFLGFDLDLWPLGVTLGQKYFHHSKAHIWLPILLLLTLSISYRFRDIRLQSF